MSEKKQTMALNVFLAKDKHSKEDFDFFIRKDKKYTEYTLASNLTFSGKLFIQTSKEKKPKWSNFVDTVTGTVINDINTKSSSAVLVIKARERQFAFSFGYGRFLIKDSCFEQEFGIKTALNTLNHDSLKSVDLYTLDDQPVHKKTEAVKNSEVNAFGIDISKDILRAVTGAPKSKVPFKRITGGGAVLSFAHKFSVSELSSIAEMLLGYYKGEEYKENFYWVDNIRKIKDDALINTLNSILLSEITKRNFKQIHISIPEFVDWELVEGFSFTRSKKEVKPVLDSHNYLLNIDEEKVSIDSIKRDRVFIHDVNEEESSFSVFQSIYFECTLTDKNYVLFNGSWFGINKDFASRIDTQLNNIPISTLSFPPIHTWEDDVGKNRIEHEADYNERAAKLGDYYLLDKKLVKSSTTTSSIELCDLLTINKQFIHVKHRKGGSSGLSHLFAQGNISAEILLGDSSFRKAARTVLRKVDSTLPELIPINKLNSSEYEIVFLILGEEPATIKSSLPFFSKVNLVKTYDNLTQRGYNVSVSGAGKIERP